MAEDMQYIDHSRVVAAEQGICMSRVKVYEPTKSHPWNDAIRRAHEALRSGHLGLKQAYPLWLKS